MIYVETEKEISRSFKHELIAAGVPVVRVGSSKRRVGSNGRAILEGGKVKKFPRALTVVGAEESDRNTVMSVLAAHVSHFDHAIRKVREIKLEAGQRIESIAPAHTRENANALWVSLLEIRINGDALTASQRASAKQARDLRIAIKAIRDASDAIESEVLALSDLDAGNFDVENHAAWPTN